MYPIVVPRDNRLKLLIVDQQWLASLFQGPGTAVAIRVAQPKLPDDAKVISVNYEFDRRGFAALIWSASFEEVPMGSKVPIWDKDGGIATLEVRYVYGDRLTTLPIDRRLQTLQIQLASADAALQRPLENEVWKEADAAKLIPYRPVGERLSDAADEQPHSEGDAENYARLRGPSPLTAQLGQFLKREQMEAMYNLPTSVPLKDQAGNVIGSADVDTDGKATLHVEESSREWFQREMSRTD